MKKNHNIMILSRALSYGGAERVATNLATYLSKDYNVILVVIDGSNNTYGSTVETIDLGLSILDKGNKIKWFWTLYKEVKSIKIKYQITDCISFLTEPDFVNILTRRYSRAIISIRNKRSVEVAEKIRILRDKWLFKRADRIVALSRNVKEDLVCNYDLSPDLIDVIYNICDRSVIVKKATDGIPPEEQRWYTNGVTVITTGRFMKQKGQWHLIRAFSEVVKVVPNAKLILLGQGGKEEYLKQLIADYRLENSICLLGYKANPYPYLSKADLFVFSSLFEGLGNSILEAMACGIPILSTDCDAGPRELLAPETDYKLTGKAEGIYFGEAGVLAPIFDGIEYVAAEPITKSELVFADAIIKLLQDNKLRSEYRKKAEIRGNDFSVESIIKQWKDVIERDYNES